MEKKKEGLEDMRRRTEWKRRRKIQKKNEKKNNFCGLSESGKIDKETEWRGRTGRGEEERKGR